MSDMLKRVGHLGRLHCEEHLGKGRQAEEALAKGQRSGDEVSTTSRFYERAVKNKVSPKPPNISGS